MTASIWTSLENAPKFVETVQKMAETTIGMIVLGFFVFGYVLLKAHHIPAFQWWMKRKEERNKQFDTYLNYAGKDPTCEAVIKDLRSADIFELATGMRVEGKWRDALHEIHNQTGATWHELKKAWRFVDIDEQNKPLIKKFGFWTYVEIFFNWIMTLLLVLLGTFTFVSLKLHEANVTPSESIVMMLAVVFLFMAAIWCAGQNSPMSVANKVRIKMDLFQARRTDTGTSTA